MIYLKWGEQNKKRGFISEQTKKTECDFDISSRYNSRDELFTHILEITPHDHVRSSSVLPVEEERPGEEEDVLDGPTGKRDDLVRPESS
jgi:hypothetical protein